MENNRLSLHVKWNINEINIFLDQIINFFLDNRIFNSELLLGVENLKAISGKFPDFNTATFYNENIGLDTQILIQSEFYPSRLHERWRWFNLEFVFNTADLADNKAASSIYDFAFEYNADRRVQIMNLSKKLYAYFKPCYLVFTNEFQDVYSFQDIENTLRRRRGRRFIEGDFEFALVQDDSIGAVFSSDCSCSPLYEYREICHSHFLPQRVCHQTKRSSSKLKQPI